MGRDDACNGDKGKVLMFFGEVLGWENGTTTCVVSKEVCWFWESEFGFVFGKVGVVG